MIYTFEHGAYTALSSKFEQEAVNHSVREHVRGIALTQGTQPSRFMLKRAHKGTFYKHLPNFLDWYLREFTAQHNLQEQDKMVAAAPCKGGKRMRYRDLTADNGLTSEENS